MDVERVYVQWVGCTFISPLEVISTEDAIGKSPKKELDLEDEDRVLPVVRLEV